MLQKLRHYYTFCQIYIYIYILKKLIFFCVVTLVHHFKFYVVFNLSQIRYSFLISYYSFSFFFFLIANTFFQVYEGNKRSPVSMNGIRQEQHDIFAGLSTAIGKQAAKKTRLEPDLKVPVSQSENDIDRQTTGESVCFFLYWFIY